MVKQLPGIKGGSKSGHTGNKRNRLPFSRRRKRRQAQRGRESPERQRQIPPTLEIFRRLKTPTAIKSEIKFSRGRYRIKLASGLRLSIKGRELPEEQMSPELRQMVKGVGPLRGERNWDVVGAVGFGLLGAGLSIKSTTKPHSTSNPFLVFAMAGLNVMDARVRSRMMKSRYGEIEDYLIHSTNHVIMEAIRGYPTFIVVGGRLFFTSAEESARFFGMKLGIRKGRLEK